MTAKPQPATASDDDLPGVKRVVMGASPGAAAALATGAAVPPVAAGGAGEAMLPGDDDA